MEKSLNTAIILAGGKSSRMGFDKQFLAISQTKLLDRTILSLSEEFEEIILVTNRISDYKDYPIKCIRDEIPNIGPLGGLHAGLKNSNSEMAYFIACDMPNLQLDYIRYMKSLILESDFDACITKFKDHLEPFHAFYSKKLLPSIEYWISKGKYSLLHPINNCHALYIEESTARQFSPDWQMFANINTPEDLDNFLKSAYFCKDF